MATINLGSYPRLLEPGIRSIFGQSYNDYPSYTSKLFEVRKSDKNAETSVQVTGFGLARKKDSGAEITMDGSKQGYSNRVAHTVWALGYRITEEARDDNLYKEVIGRLTPRLARSMRVTKEIVGHNIFNRAFDSSITYGDGTHLCSANHATIGGGTQSNVAAIAADVSDTAMRALYYQARLARDDKNIPIDINIKEIVAHVTKQFEIEEILKSKSLVNTDYNNINVWERDGIVKGIILTPYLTSQKAWFFKTDCPDSLVQYNRKALTLDTDVDFLTKDVIVTARERYSHTCNDWRGVYGNPGA